jgi:hypothetical protein
MNSIKFGKLTICLVVIQGRKTYELWHDDKPEALGRFDSFSEARDAAIREENRMNSGEEND